MFWSHLYNQLCVQNRWCLHRTPNLYPYNKSMCFCMTHLDGFRYEIQYLDDPNPRLWFDSHLNLFQLSYPNLLIDFWNIQVMHSQSHSSAIPYLGLYIL